MSLRFVIGRAGSGKSTLCLRSARRVKTTPERENNIISCARTDDIPDAAGVNWK